MHLAADEPIASGMAYDAERVRTAMQAVATARGLKPRPWAEKAGASANLVRKFLAGETGTISLEYAVRLADVAQVSLSQLVGEVSLEEGVPPSREEALAALEEARRLLQEQTARAAEMSAQVATLIRSIG